MIRHEELAHVRKRWRGTGILRARRRVEVIEVDETFPVELETLTTEQVPTDEHDSGRIEVLPDGSVSIPIYAEELIITRRTMLKERVIIRKEITTKTTNVTTELHAEHVEIDSEGTVDIIGDTE